MTQHQLPTKLDFFTTFCDELESALYPNARSPTTSNDNATTQKFAHCDQNAFLAKMFLQRKMTALSSRLSLLLVCILAARSQALIVTPGPATKQTVGNTLSDQTTKGISSKQTLSVARIRSMRRSDVESVADLLASAITGDRPSDNWNARVERLRVRSSIKTTLDLRVRAIEEGKKHVSQSVDTLSQSEAISLQVTENTDHLNYLWSKESFRNKVAQAADLSSEPHPWEHHNFALAPKDPCWLRHEMIAAECTQTGKIVGFCEIAMLLCPPLAPPQRDYSDSIDFVYGDDYDDDEEYCTIECAPTIANLAVSPDWRRRGIAKGLMKSAERLVERKWKSTELGLYVEKRNQRAIKLYSDAGYKVKSSLSDKDASDKWYMSKQFTT